LERARLSSELLAIVGEVDRALTSRDVAQIIRQDLKGRTQPLRLPHEQRSALEWHKQPLMRIERDGITATESREQRSPAVSERSKSAVRRVGMQPGSLRV